MKWTWFISVLLFLMLFLLHGCAAALDADDLALAEKSDIVCLAHISGAAYLEPEGRYCILKCQAKADYLGNLREGYNFYLLLEGADLDIDACRDQFREKTKYSGQAILFLKQDPVETVYHVSQPAWGEFRVFLPAGKNALRWGGIVDAEGLRLQDALRAYGKTHPREKIKTEVYQW